MKEQDKLGDSEDFNDDDDLLWEAISNVKRLDGDPNNLGMQERQCKGQMSLVSYHDLDSIG